MNKRYGLFTGSGVEPHWSVWVAEIDRKKINAETKKRLMLLLSLNECLHLIVVISVLYIANLTLGGPAVANWPGKPR